MRKRKEAGVGLCGLRPHLDTGDCLGVGDTYVGSGEQRFGMLELGFKFVNCFGHLVRSEVRRFQSMIEGQGRSPDQPVLML